MSDGETREITLSRSEVKSALQSMDNEKFEHWVAELWSRQGWETEVSQKSQDKSLDVLAEKSQPYHQRHAIQAKRYQAGNKVGGPSINEYATLTDYFDADAAVVVTTSGFTTDARERAETLGVKLVNGDDLIDMIERTEAYDLLASLADQRSNTDVGDDHSNIDIGDDRGPMFEILAFSAGIYILGIVLTGIVASTLFGLGLLGMLSALIYDIYTIRSSDLDWAPKWAYWIWGTILIPFITVPAFYFRLSSHGLEPTPSQLITRIRRGR